MNTPAILLTVLACLYTFIQVGGWIAVCSVVERRQRYTLNLNLLFVIDTLLLAAAYAADTYL